MLIHHPAFRMIALVLVLVLGLTLTTPAKADAFDILTAVAIGTLVVAGIILVVYLIVANVHGSKMSEADPPVLVACAESETAPRACWPLPPGATITPAFETVQGP
jgi:hypothetical protein